MNQPDWFEVAFGPRYLQLYAHRDRGEAAAVLDTVIAPDELRGQRVLDLACGPGRYLVELAGRGALAVGLDLSQPLLRAAQELDLNLPLVCGDMRWLPFTDASFEATFCMFTSFGYFETRQQHRDLAEEMKRVTRGTLIVDVPNPVVLRETLVPHSRRQVAGYEVEERRSMQSDPMRVAKTMELHDPSTGLRERYEERVMLFTSDDLEDLFGDAHWSVSGRWGDYAGAAFDPAKSPRLLSRWSRDDRP